MRIVATIKVFGKNEQVRKVFWSLFVVMTGPRDGPGGGPGDGTAGGWGY